MLALVLTVVATTPSPSLAVMEFSSVNTTPQLATFAADQVSQQLTRRGLKVVSASDLATVLGLERQRELLGCSDDKTSCLTELAQALGSDFLVSGTLARLGTSFQLSLKLLDAKSGRPRRVWTDSVSNEADLPSLFARGGDALSSEFVTSAPLAAVGAGFWVPLGAGVALLGGGVASLVVAENASASLRQPSTAGVLDPAEARATRDRGAVTQVLGPVLLGAGAATILVGTIVQLASGHAPAARVGVAVGPGSAAVTVGGAF